MKSSILTTVLVIAAAAAASWIIPIEERKVFMDSATGSTRIVCERWPCFKSEERRPSPLRRRLERLGKAGTYDWRFVSSRALNFWGEPLVRACGSPPAIYDLSGEILSQRLVADSTEAQLIDFVTVMRCGSDEEQRALIEATSARLLSVER